MLRQPSQLAVEIHADFCDLRLGEAAELQQQRF
jgi:hypothetical protein